MPPPRGENDYPQKAAHHTTKNPLFFNLTAEIENRDSYLVFLLLQQFLNYVIICQQG